MTLHLTALRDFLTRYAQVFKAAWRIRDALDAPKRSGDELAFLPAHLELIDTPVSPTARWAMRLILALFCVALTWAVLGKLDVVAIAPGKTVPGSRTKILQPLEAAVVRHIHVRDGQAVKQGEVLIELDATQAAADFKQAEDALLNARAAAARFAALLAAYESGQPPALAAGETLPSDRHVEAQRLAQSQFAAYLARRDALAAAVAQREAELHTTTELVRRLEQSANIASARAESFRNLLDKQYVARQDYLALEAERVATERDLATQRSRLQEIGSALAGQRQDLQAHIADARQQALDGLRQAREQAQQLEQDVAKAAQRDRMTVLRAPVDGSVQQLAVHTVGGVVTPAQPLLAIVPQDEALEVEAWVLNKDIGFVREGQQAVVKIESFPYTRYGYLTGEVESVSHDAVQDERLGLVYQARVRLKDTALAIDGVRVNLTAGMNLSVEIKTDRRQVIDYLLSPLKRHTTEALRER